jgi:small subunit ribosomal protein S16
LRYVNNARLIKSMYLVFRCVYRRCLKSRGLIHLLVYNLGFSGVSLAGWPVVCLNRLKIYGTCRLYLSRHAPPKGLIMVVIRLSRGGSKARPFYNIVAAAKRNRRDGRYLERIGFYNPMARGGEEPLRIAQDRLAHWLSVGAQPSDTVSRLVKQGAKAVKAAE